MTRHEWRETTGDNDKRYNRASHHAGRWAFETTLANEEEWHTLDPPDLEFFQGLRDILWRKYQRNRVPHRLVLEIDEMIEDLETTEESTDPAPRS